MLVHHFIAPKLAYVEKKQQAWDFIEHGQNRQIIEKDQYGQSLCEIHLDCDEVLDYITFEYTYAEGKEEL